MFLRFSFAVALLVLLTLDASSQERPHAFVGATIVPIEGDDIVDGVLIVHQGRVSAVGAAGDVEIPADAVRRDMRDKTIMPGLICTHSHIGGFGGADGSAPIQPGVRIYDSLNVNDPGFRRAVAGGLTTLNIMPGSGHLMSGQTVYVKLRGGDTIEDICYRGPAKEILGGMKMANGTNSMKDPPFPGTRGKSAALVRQHFVRAREYRDKVTRANGDPEKLPPRDLGLEAMLDVLNKRRIVHHHTHRHDDIVTVLRLAREFDFRVVLHHVSDGWKVVDQIAAAKAPCSLIIVDSPGGKLEAIDLVYETGRLLEEAGVEVAFHTDDWITDSRLFLRSPALAVRAGMSRQGALGSVTLAGAKMLDLDSRIGSLRSGKDADFIVLSGDPLSVYTKVLETWVEGRKVFDREDPEDRLHAVGGFGAGSDHRPYSCCLGEEAPR